METTQFNDKTGPRNRPPSLLACIACRRRHLKCNGQMPVCKRCQDTGSECSYQQSRRGYKGPRKNVEVGKVHEIAPNVGATTNLTRTPNAASVRRIPGVDYDMIGDTFAIGAFPDTVNPHYSSPQELYHTNGTNVGLSPPMDDGRHGETAIRSQHNTVSPPMSGIQHAELAITSQHPTVSPPANIVSGISNDLLGEGNDTMIDTFYANFWNAHPFVIPRKLFRAKPTLLPPALKSVVRFVASHFIPGFSQDDLRNAADNITSDQVPANGFKVQGLMLFGMSLFARCEQELALTILDQAIDLALTLGMNLKIFAIKHGTGNPVLEESWRRTWWDVYMVDGILSSLNSIHHTFKLQNTYNDVLLPCEEFDYAQCKIPATFRTQRDFINRAFDAEQYDYSSMAYKIEAVRLLGKVVNISTDIVSTNDEQVEGFDASLANFILSLPPVKRHNIELDGKCDEILFSAHNLIDSALISLHRPRSSLTFIQNHYPTQCTRPEAIRAPISAYEVHTAKALKAANSISKATTLRTPMTMHSPCFVCATLLSATVHLPVYSIEIDMDRASAIKERLQLTINALNSIGEVWPMGRTAKTQISQFARDVFAGQAVAAGRPQMEAQIQQIDIESMMEDQTWLDELADLRPGGGNMALIGSGVELQQQSLSTVNAAPVPEQMNNYM